MAYLGWAPAVLGLYQLPGYYPEYYTAGEIAAWFGLFATLMIAPVLAVTWLGHRRVLREAAQPAAEGRKSLLRKVAVYHLWALATVLVLVPQAIRLGSRSGPYLIFFLPLPLILFAAGALKQFWAATTLERNRIRSDLLVAASLQAFPLFLIAAFAVDVLVYHVIRGVYAWRDPYYGIEYTDYTLALTPLLGFGMIVLLVWILVTEARRAPPQASMSPEPVLESGPH